MKALRSKALTLTVGALAAGGLLLAAAPSAHAAEVTKRGDCSKSSTWKLELETDDGKIEVDFDAYTAKSGKTWKYKVKQNGVVQHKGKTVSERDGDVDVDKDVDNRSGTDTIVVRVEQPQSGEVCRAKLSI
jgi:L,D-peptidoglycan transpeptidase YkuD (ErfK/YbiS/YcfS/YnhG family)